MQRRLDIALGLVNSPQVLFLDEPTTGLDPEVRADLWREIERLASDEQMTILLTTHYLEEADRLASRLAIVDRGRIVAEGEPEELKRELRGDTVVIELAEPVDGSVAALVNSMGVTTACTCRMHAWRRPHSPARAERGSWCGSRSAPSRCPHPRPTGRRQPPS